VQVDYDMGGRRAAGPIVGDDETRIRQIIGVVGDDPLGGQVTSQQPWPRRAELIGATDPPGKVSTLEQHQATTPAIEVHNIRRDSQTRANRRQPSGKEHAGVGPRRYDSQNITKIVLRHRHDVIVAAGAVRDSLCTSVRTDLWAPRSPPTIDAAMATAGDGSDGWSPEALRNTEPTVTRGVSATLRVPIIHSARPSARLR
jgi:hypothetical protein